MPDETQRPLTAADVMTPGPRTCSAFSTILEATMIFRDVQCGAVPVVDGGKPIGIVTDRDVAMAVSTYPDLDRRSVSEIMTKDVITVAPDALLPEVAEKFAEQAVHRLLVVDAAGQLQGIIAWADLAPHVSETSIGHVATETLEQPPDSA
jgi:CBS domain-containing protein